MRWITAPIILSSVQEAEVLCSSPKKQFIRNTQLRVSLRHSTVAPKDIAVSNGEFHWVLKRHYELLTENKLKLWCTKHIEHCQPSHVLTKKPNWISVKFSLAWRFPAHDRILCRRNFLLNYHWKERKTNPNCCWIIFRETFIWFPCFYILRLHSCQLFRSTFTKLLVKQRKVHWKLNKQVAFVVTQKKLENTS